jgi:DNA polymerase (family 10)
MSTNDEIARRFDEMAQGLEILGANPFRANAYARAARTLRDLDEDVRNFAAHEPETAADRLAALPGIGESTAAKILDYLEHGSIKEHREMLEKLPASLFEVLEIPGLGPKAVKLMWEQLGIASVADLEAKLDSPELAALPRMGAKSIENIRKALSFAKTGGTRTPIGIALPLAESIRDRLREVTGVQRLDFAGSLRRGRETIGDLDFLAVTDQPELLRQAFCTLAEVTQVLARGETKCSARLTHDEGVVQADLRLVPAPSWGAALLYFTGSKEHNVRLRERAVKAEQRLNEYGLYAGTDERPQDHGEEPLAAATEESVYQVLGLPYIPPELREDRGELEDGVPADLVELPDLIIELHSHTVASDGRLSIEALAEAAKARGIQLLAITDHSKSAVIANGLDEDRLRRHIDAIREANERIAGIELLSGSEVDILPDGRLDYDDEILALLDVVVASPHLALRQEPDVATERLLAAIRHPLVHILGHPTGRLIGKREGLAPDIPTLCAAAAEHDVALEINAHWLRLDLRDTHARAAIRAGAKVVINTDAHTEADLDHRRYGALVARRAGLGRAQCPSTWGVDEVKAWLGRKRVGGK